MKEAKVHKDGHVTIEETNKPEITKPHHVLIEVRASGCNPKDWKMPAGILTTIAGAMNSGDDIAGIVHAVGSAVTEFKPGDRVAALHELGTAGGSYAEYALAEDYTTFHIGPEMSFEEAATVPMAAMMAGLGLFGMVEVASPWKPLQQERPLLIYGASSAVGSFAVQYAQLLNIHPLICVAGRGGAAVEAMLDKSKGDSVIDYRSGEVVEGIKQALSGRKLIYAFDAISEKGSHLNIAQVLDAETGRISFVLPGVRKELPDTVMQNVTMAGSFWKPLQPLETQPNVSTPGILGLPAGGQDFALVLARLTGKMLADGRLKPYPYKVGKNGLHSLEEALRSLRENTTSGFKHVFRIADTPTVD